MLFRSLSWREAEPRGIKQAFGSSQLTNGILAWISGVREQRSFVWGHYPDAHAPYLDTHDRRFDGTATGPSPYEREVSYVDYHLGRLLAALERAHILDRTIVIVTGDHGEELGQTGRQGHGFSLYEHSIRVPLFVRIPGCAPARQEAPVSLAQIGPSLGALLAVDIPGLPLWAPRPADALPVVSETLIDKHTFRRAIIGPRDKMIVDVLSGGQVLFDLRADPREERDIYASDHAATAEAEARYQRWLDR